MLINEWKNQDGKGSFVIEIKIHVFFRPTTIGYRDTISQNGKFVNLSVICMNHHMFVVTSVHI